MSEASRLWEPFACFGAHLDHPFGWNSPEWSCRLHLAEKTVVG
jgi:hypothetical protein